jgi:hypothetical protein
LNEVIIDYSHGTNKVLECWSLQRDKSVLEQIKIRISTRNVSTFSVNRISNMIIFGAGLTVENQKKN